MQSDGISRKFPSQPLIDAQAQIVSQFRRANGLPRSSIRESLEDIDQFNAQRMGCQTRYTVPINTPQGQPAPVAMAPNAPLINPCKGCGAPM